MTFIPDKTPDSQALRKGALSATHRPQSDDPEVCRCLGKFAMTAMGRVPVFPTGHRQTAVRRTPDIRSCTTGMCCLAVIRGRLLVGA